jgi:hypothetical protein
MRAVADLDRAVLDARGRVRVPIACAGTAASACSGTLRLDAVLPRTRPAAPRAASATRARSRELCGRRRPQRRRDPARAVEATRAVSPRPRPCGRAWCSDGGAIRHPGASLMAAPTAFPASCVTEHEFACRSTTRARGRPLTVFAREVADPTASTSRSSCYLQGGPGFEAPRPTGDPKGPAWWNGPCEDFRVLMLDQRGTGRSSPVGALAT